MRASVLLVAVAVSASTARAEEPARWELSAAAGASSTSFTTPGMELGASRGGGMVDGATARELEPAALFSLRYRIADRVVWSIPTLSFAYLGGTADRAWIPWAGLVSWGAGYSSIEHFLAQGRLGAGAGFRQAVAPSLSLNLTAALESELRYTSQPVCAAGTMCPESWTSPDPWRASVTAGVSYRLGGSVTMNLGVAGSARLASDERGATLSFGSVQAIGLRLLPLVEAQLSPRWSLDGYAAAAYDLGTDRIEQRYLAGVTRRWFTAR